MSNTGLGRGLGALIPRLPKLEQISSRNELLKSEEESGVRVVELPLDAIVPNSAQPRTVFDEVSLAELASSIRQYGVLSPIIVEEVGSGKYAIIAGERRWRAARLAGLDTIPAIVRETGEQERLELALVENIQRRDLDAIEEAMAYDRLGSEFDLTQEEIADRMGKSRSQIANFIRLLALPEDIRRALQEGMISVGHAKVILGMEDEESQRNLFRKILENELSVRDAEGLVPVKSTFRRSEGNPADPRWSDWEQTLSEELSARVLICRKGKCNEIRIQCEPEELEEIVEKLKE
ncbi:MAG: chromosome partitioning protein, ParB family [Parcubacteria group bacterium Gr01-1014_18]|nr:MAG: chromosome partitioning protein, ParB family [Parcubacteria group bacterium Greene0416_36]TSC81278.1 MAG: chromosome partitioning protein, ParB family [Parcubacteria group bacterium Gr01-1014_18]TSC99300.1 MAG: chromosome partitioning protein, ParB family [Parcubacteria group bacterium Greene1014_20]TSD06863.1 MAG: chromosome partitioning protein, ParB family [Parcubacteria group bacterium Greene0714_2]